MFHAKPLTAIVAVLAISACSVPSATPHVDMTKAPEGRDMQADLAVCDDVANSAIGDGGLVASAINTGIRSLIHGSLSPYSVSGLAQRATNTAANAPARKDSYVKACMRRAGWKVY